MLPIRTESQPYEIALVRFIAEPLVGIFDDLICFQVKHRDRLMRERLLRAIAVVQQGGIAAIRTEGHGRWKAVGAANSSGRWDGQYFAGGEHDGRTTTRRLLRQGEGCDG